MWRAQAVLSTTPKRGAATADGWEQSRRRSTAKQFTPCRKFFVLSSHNASQSVLQLPEMQAGDLKPLVTVGAGWWGPTELGNPQKSASIIQLKQDLLLYFFACGVMEVEKDIPSLHLSEPPCPT